MIKTIVFNGGLGNQMFQYAFYLRLKKEHPLSFFLFNIESAQNSHCGYELDKIFHIESTSQIKSYHRLKKYLPKHISTFRTIKQPNCFEYIPQICTGKHFFTQFEGFWQNPTYFDSVIQEVKKAFSFRKEKINKKTKEICSLIKESNSVSIHVRRGDYLQHTHDFGLCSPCYYNDAIALIEKNIERAHFFLFSDDIEWAKSNIHCKNITYIDWNTGENSWQDMYLMSCCKHNIIANSSFSWWGAWLNSNVNKITIAPTPWVVFAPNDDILPHSWIKIKK